MNRFQAKLTVDQIQEEVERKTNMIKNLKKNFWKLLFRKRWLYSKRRIKRAQLEIRELEKKIKLISGKYGLIVLISLFMCVSCSEGCKKPSGKKKEMIKIITTENHNGYRFTVFEFEGQKYLATTYNNVKKIRNYDKH